MLEWLKEILGDAYTGEIDKKVSEEIGKGFVARADFNTANETRKELEQQIKARDKDIAELKKLSGSNEELQKQYDALQGKYKAETAELNKRIADSQKNSAVEMAILQAKGRNTKAIKALLDLDKISIKEDGTIEGLDLEGLKKSDGYLFDIEETKTVGMGVTAGKPATPDISKMNYSQLAAYMAENQGAKI